MSDSTGAKKIGIDADAAQQSIKKLRGYPDAAIKTPPTVGSDWGDSHTLVEFHTIFSRTMTHLGKIHSSTREFSTTMVQNIELTVRDLNAANRTAAEESARLLQELDGSHTGVNLSQLGKEAAPPLPTLSRGSPGNRSDIDAILQGGSSDNTGGSPRGGGGNFRCVDYHKLRSDASWRL